MLHKCILHLVFAMGLDSTGLSEVMPASVCFVHMLHDIHCHPDIRVADLFSLCQHTQEHMPQPGCIATFALMKAFWLLQLGLLYASNNTITGYLPSSWGNLMQASASTIAFVLAPLGVRQCTDCNLQKDLGHSLCCVHKQ